MPRKKISSGTEAALLRGCRRRCAICFGMHRDAKVKRGQIAHLDHDPSNNDLDNLAFLCFDHHDLYDTTPRQSKGLTMGEVKVFRAELEEALEAAFSAPIALDPDAEPVDEVQHTSWEGVYRRQSENSSAEIQVERRGADLYTVRGIAFWGTARPNGPNTGELEAEARVHDGHLIVRQGDYELELALSRGGLSGEERWQRQPFGMNVSFAGVYERVPRGAEALPQPSLRAFESEFWPEEGRPVFISRASPLRLHSRPTSDAPVVGELKVELGSRIQFAGFRYRTLRPGVILAHADGELTGRNLGARDYVSRANYYEDGGEPVSLRYETGDRIEYLQYRAEGTGFIRWQGLVIDTYLPWLDPDARLELHTDPVAESWVQVTDTTSEVAGWVLADEALEEVDRAF